jgi:glycosyltransferase involved in cell wall biosynthesis
VAEERAAGRNVTRAGAPGDQPRAAELGASASNSPRSFRDHPGASAPLKVAIVHDWLTNQGGGERVVCALHEAFPDAPIYTSVFNAERLPQFADLDVRTSFLQHWPLAKSRHQLYPTLRTVAFESFDLSQYDVVISSSSAEAKGVITGPSAIHICYLHTPTRYYWSDYAKYRRQTGFGLLSPLVRLIMPGVIEKMRLWDFAAAGRVDHFITNSAYVAKRTNKYYRRQSTVIHPPIDGDRFQIKRGPKRGYVVVSRLIPYKRVDLAVVACTKLNLPLTVVGDGSEMEKLKAMAGPSIRFTGRLTDQGVARELSEASAFIFTAEEDFGLTPLEAMASGIPVLAYGKGGARETVVHGQTGTFFNEQSVNALVEALKKFDPSAYDPEALRSYALEFDQSVFIKNIKKFVEDKIKEIKKDA